VCEIPEDGAAGKTGLLEVGDVLLSIDGEGRDVLRSVDDESTGGKSFVEIMRLIERAEDSSNARLLFRVPTVNAAVETDAEKGAEDTKKEEKEKNTAIDDGNPDPTTTPPPPPTPPPRPGQIPDANRPVLLSLLSSYESCLPIDLGIAHDNDVSTHDGVGVSYEVVRVPLEDGGVSAVLFDLRRGDDDDSDGDSGGGDRDGRTMASQMLLCLTDAGDGVISQSSMDNLLVVGLLSSRSMVGGGKNDGADD